MGRVEEKLKAPFPYFGGKSKIADKVWGYLGDVKTYIEPFFGSGAVLLARPRTKHDTAYEIVNDKDAFLCNVWRSLQKSPEETAKYSYAPVSHIDLHARRNYLKRHRELVFDKLMNDPEWHDPKLAGYWIYGMSNWIGVGFMKEDREDTNLNLLGPIPILTCKNGIMQKSELESMIEWLKRLSIRLMNVKITCGDWKILFGGKWREDDPPVGVFFDPPYSTERDEVYDHDDFVVAREVADWCLENGGNQNYRIILCGYVGEHDRLLENGWKFERWIAVGGYSNRGRKNDNDNRFKECIYISPHCLRYSLF